jgi:hypothetical protein
MVRTFLKVYMELGSTFLFLQEQIKDIIIFPSLRLLIQCRQCWNFVVLCSTGWGRVKQCNGKIKHNFSGVSRISS